MVKKEILCILLKTLPVKDKEICQQLFVIRRIKCDKTFKI